MVTSNAATGYVAKISMPEPMLSLSMLILATYPSANSQHVLECLERRSARSERAECSQHFWTPGNTVRGQHSLFGQVLGHKSEKALKTTSVGKGNAPRPCNSARCAYGQVGYISLRIHKPWFKAYVSDLTVANKTRAKPWLRNIAQTPKLLVITSPVSGARSC